MECPVQEVFHYKDQDHFPQMLLQLNSLRQERVFIDLLLCSDNQEIPCHRNILVSSSPYFKAMFCNNFRETQQNRVDLKGVSATILSSIVDYVYTGQITITMENVLPLMQSASMLQYNHLFEACSVFLQGQLSPDNCLSMVRLSKILDCTSLREKAREMAMRSFSDVVESEDLCELSLPELMGYLEDDCLCAEEEQVFETLLAWIHHDPFSRHGAIHDLFKKVMYCFSCVSQPATANWLTTEALLITNTTDLIVISRFVFATSTPLTCSSSSPATLSFSPPAYALKSSSPSAVFCSPSTPWLLAT